MFNVNQLIQNLNGLTIKKHEYFNELLLITKAQQEDIQKNAAENMLALVEKKQSFIDKIDGLDKAFQMQFEQLKSELNIDNLDKMDILKYPDLKILRENVGAIMSLAGDITKLEKENDIQINVLYDLLKKELKRINIGKQSMKAYEPQTVNTDGVYIDKKK